MLQVFVAAVVVAANTSLSLFLSLLQSMYPGRASVSMLAHVRLHGLDLRPQVHLYPGTRRYPSVPGYRARYNFVIDVRKERKERMERKRVKHFIAGS